MHQATLSSSRLLVTEASARPATCCPCLCCVIHMLTEKLHEANTILHSKINDMKRLKTDTVI